MEEKEVLVKVEGISKKFCKDLKKSLWYGVKDLFSNVGGNKNERLLRDKEFWALKDINFELRRGECLGLIGHNGAGKSTLLKILNGLINPDGGSVTMRGRVGALIELGAGFNPILSGRENIYNNGAVLGFSKQEIDDKIEDIIDFAEIREFIDMPVQNYSSGMKVRLGFAVAAQMEPDILIIDEVLAVGDLGFVLKCFKRIDTILPQTAIVFVSHNMPMVSRICNRIILLGNGQERFYGSEISKGIDLYYNKFAGNEKSVVFDNGTIKLIDIAVKDSNKFIKDNIKLKWNQTLNIKIDFELISMPVDINIRLIVVDKENRPIAIFRDSDESFNIDLKNKKFSVFMNHDKVQFSNGVYSLNILVSEGKNRSPLLRINDVLRFQIQDHLDVFPPFMLNANYFM